MEVNPNSSLYDFADDNAAFLNSPVLVSELINIRDNYENMDLGALKEAYSRLTTDLASLSGAGELEKEVRAQISLQQGTLFDANNTGAVTNDTSYDNTQESIKETSTTSVNSNLSDYKDFAPPSDTSKADTNEVLYNLNDDKQKAFYEEEINKTNTTISEAEFNSRFTGNELNQNITDASIANISSTTFNNAAMEAANELEADKANADIAARINMFDQELEFRTDSWNAANAQAVEQSNVEWRRKSNTIDTAAQNAANQQAAGFAFSLSNAAQAQLWQELRATATFDFQSGQADLDRKINLINTALGNEAFLTNDGLSSERTRIFNLLRDLTA